MIIKIFSHQEDTPIVMIAYHRDGQLHDRRYFFKGIIVQKVIANHL